MHATQIVRVLFFGFLAAFVLVADLKAELVRFEITERSPFANGQTFGDVGAYERIVGKVYYELDPQLEQNANVVDLKLAPRNKNGKVEVVADLFMLAPADLSKASGSLLYDVNNRGNKLALRFFNLANGGNNPNSKEHAGDGFLMRHGFVVVWSGWTGELLPEADRLRLSAPIAKQPDGSPITGNVRCEIVPSGNTKRTVVNWANHGSYRPTKSALATATLTHRLRPLDERVPVSQSEWQVHVSDVDSDLPNQLPKVELEFPGELKNNHIYELIYEAQDPHVMGVGFTAVRDLISALRNGTGAANPLLGSDEKPVVQRAYTFGVSQSGRFIRELLYWGFNEDEKGRQVFDGVIPHVSGSGLGSFNHRFAQPTRHSAQHDHHDYPPDRFPFSYAVQTDPLSEQTDGILRRAIASKTAPIVLHTQSAAEYWTRSGSLTHTDPLGQKDIENPDNVRLFVFGGTQHGPSGFPPGRNGQNLANPGDYRPFLRALLLAMDRAVQGKGELPKSVFPTIEGSTLVDWHQESTGFPVIPGIDYPKVIQQPIFLDFGPRWLTERIIDFQPPRYRGDYRVLVPKCGTDGNELGCLLAAEVAVPVATYTGWNINGKDSGVPDELVSLAGSYIPFPVTKANRQSARDPRRSLEERYGTIGEYLKQLKAYCEMLEQRGLLLSEDTAGTLKTHKERVEPLFKQITAEK